MSPIQTVLTGSFLWQVDDNAVFSYGDDQTPTFFTLPASQWENMGKPADITILVTASSV